MRSESTSALGQPRLMNPTLPGMGDVSPVRGAQFYLVAGCACHAWPTRVFTVMRSFLGLPVTGALRQQLQRYCATAPAGLARWEAVDDWHLTLVFLGELAPAGQAALATAAAARCRALA